MTKNYGIVPNNEYRSKYSYIPISKRLLRKIRSMCGCLFRGSSIKLLVVICRLFLPQHSDVGDITVDSCCTVYLLLKHFTQQVAHGLSNDNVPSTITQGMTGKTQNSVLQTYEENTVFVLFNAQVILDAHPSCL